MPLVPPDRYRPEDAGDEEVPEWMQCPITQELFRDPAPHALPSKHVMSMNSSTGPEHMKYT